MRRNDYALYFFKFKLEEIQKAKDGSFVDRLSWYLFYIQERYDFANSRYLKENLDRDLDEAIKVSKQLICLPKQMTLGDKYNLLKTSFALFIEKEMRDYKKANRDKTKQDKETEEALFAVDMAISLKHEFDFLSVRLRSSRQSRHSQQLDDLHENKSSVDGDTVSDRGKPREPKAQESRSKEYTPQKTHISETVFKRIFQRALSIARCNKG